MSFVGILAACGFIISWFRITKYHIVVYISVFLALCASFIGKYPFCNRLVLFLYPIMVIYIFTALDSITFKGKGFARNVVSIGLLITLFLSNCGSLGYLKEENRHVARNEINPLIDYLEENIKDDEMLYVYYLAIPAYTFKMGHGNEKIGKNIEDNVKNVIFGAGIVSLNNEIGGVDDIDILEIKELQKCYILVSHQDREIIGNHFRELSKYGEIELVMEEYGTPLFYYRKNRSAQ